MTADEVLADKAPCQHCGSTDLEVIDLSSDKYEGDWIECTQCLAGAPADVWNRSFAA